MSNTLVSQNSKVQIYGFEIETAEQSQKRIQLVKSYVVNTANLSILERLKNDVEKNDDAILNTKRKLTKSFLAKVLQTDPSNICSIAQETLDTIMPIMEKKCLVVNEEGMNNVIVEFLKLHKETKEINLTYFKDEIRGKSLINLFEALPQTNVNVITIARPLTQEENEAKEKAEKSLKDRVLVVNIKG